MPLVEVPEEVRDRQWERLRRFLHPFQSGQFPMSAVFVVTAFLALAMGGVRVWLDDRGAIESVHGLGGLLYSEGTLQPRLHTTTAISLCGCPATDGDLKLLRRFSQLRRLDLSKTLVTDGGIDDLLAMPRLVQLDVTGSEITPQGLARLRAERPDLKIGPFPWRGT
jgi:hypothetical protein